MLGWPWGSLTQDNHMKYSNSFKWWKISTLSNNYSSLRTYRTQVIPIYLFLEDIHIPLKKKKDIQVHLHLPISIRDNNISHVITERSSSFGAYKLPYKTKSMKYCLMLKIIRTFHAFVSLSSSKKLIIVSVLIWRWSHGAHYCRMIAMGSPLLPNMFSKEGWKEIVGLQTKVSKIPHKCFKIFW